MSDPNALERVPLCSWTGALGPLLMAPLVLLLLTVMLAPNDVLESWPLAKRFTASVVHQLPWIQGLAGSTAYAQVALLTTCLAVVLLLWTTAVWVAQSIVNYRILVSNQRRRRTVRWRSALFVTFLVVPVLLLCIRLALGLPGDPSWAAGLATNHRAGLGLLVVSLVYGGGMILGSIPLLFRLLIDLDLRKET